MGEKNFQATENEHEVNHVQINNTYSLAQHQPLLSIHIEFC
jgi:hypothetical protein